MNKTELELRMKSLKKQQELTSKAMEDTQKQLDDLNAEENFKDTQKVLEKFLKFKGNLETCDSNTLLVSIEHDTLEKFRLMKNWNFWNRRPVLKLIKAAEEIKALIEECGMDTTIDYDDKPVKTE